VNPNFRKVALIAAALGLIVSLFIALSRGDDDDVATPAAKTTAPSATTASSGPLQITIDTAKGGIYRGTVKLGRKVVVTVRANVTDEAHLHAYDIKAKVAPGKPGQIEFTASIPGQFEIELEDRHKLIAVLEVRP
jgi:hypothetical protein